MNRDPCQTIEELLVDFADEALAGAEAARVRRHVEQCPQCRTTVAALRQSLQCTRTIWQDNLPPVQSHRRPVWRALRWRYVAAAAVILLAVGTLTHRPSRPEPAPSAPTLAEIENRIAMAGRAARLLAATNALETQTTLREMAEYQYRYIVDQYPGTTAAEPARRKLQSLR